MKQILMIQRIYGLYVDTHTDTTVCWLKTRFDLMSRRNVTNKLATIKRNEQIQLKQWTDRNERKMIFLFLKHSMGVAVYEIVYYIARALMNYDNWLFEMVRHTSTQNTNKNLISNA